MNFGGIGSKTYSVPTSLCLECGALAEAATALLPTGLTPHAPQPGWPTVCLTCGAILAFTDTLTLRRSVPADHLDWALRAPDQYSAVCATSREIKRRPLDPSRHRRPRRPN